MRKSELLSESETFRGFNTTHMAPLVLGEFHRQIFEKTDTEIIYLPHIVEKLLQRYPERAWEAIDRGHLAMRTRDDLPYCLAISTSASESGATTRPLDSCRCSLMRTHRLRASGPTGSTPR